MRQRRGHSISTHHSFEQQPRTGQATQPELISLAGIALPTEWPRPPAQLGLAVGL
jgi:hypothetical protein